MLDKLRLILYLILIFIGLIALLYIAPIFFIVSIIILWMGIKDLDKKENKKKERYSNIKRYIFIKFSIHFIFVNLWLYKHKTLELTLVEL